LGQRPVLHVRHFANIPAASMRILKIVGIESRLIHIVSRVALNMS
jgi:hypothetical protein